MKLDLGVQGPNWCSSVLDPIRFQLKCVHRRTPGHFRPERTHSLRPAVRVRIQEVIKLHEPFSDYGAKFRVNYAADDALTSVGNVN